jgi:hypothetical protein
MGTPKVSKDHSDEEGAGIGIGGKGSGSRGGVCQGDTAIEATNRKRKEIN